MYNLEYEFNEMIDKGKLPFFEFEVIDKRTGEQCYIDFDIFVNIHVLEAQHEPLNKEEEESKFVASKEVDIDTDFDLDYHLELLYDVCVNAINESEFFKQV